MVIPATESLAEFPTPEDEERSTSRRRRKDRKDKEFAGRSPLQIAMGRLRRDRVAIVCGVTVLLLVVLAVLAPLINNLMQISGTISGKYSLDGATATEFDGIPAIGPPLHDFTWDHPLGIAPGTAVDNLARLLLGLRTSLLIATIATVISTIVGVCVGLVAGFSRGWLDRVISFVIDLFLSFPFLLGALAIAPILVDRYGSTAATLGRAQFISLTAILVIFGWMSLARLVRGQVLSLREREFIQAAEVIGAPTRRILFKELLPNLVAPIVIAISLGLPTFVAAEAGLSFLGIGLTGEPSLGQIINAADGYYDQYPLYLFAPVTVVAVLVLALNLLGDSIRDAFDPKARR
ncbi:MAG: ABC transporter permease [Actinomycetota bacterium]|nr:ABC transporter permease [Actinomycetota bacterium]